MACRAEMGRGPAGAGQERSGCLFKALEETRVVAAPQETWLGPEPVGQALASVPGAQGSHRWVGGSRGRTWSELLSSASHFPWARHPFCLLAAFPTVPPGHPLPPQEALVFRWV